MPGDWMASENEAHMQRALGGKVAFGIGAECYILVAPGRSNAAEKLHDAAGMDSDARMAGSGSRYLG